MRGSELLGHVAQTLRQAQASGRLQGDELRSLMENAPRFCVALAEGMREIDPNLSIPTKLRKLREMAAEGKLTADVIGNALA